MEIGRSYERAGKWLAASIRFRNVIDNYQTTSHAPEALYRLVETNLALGIAGGGAEGGGGARRELPGSEWYERAYELIGRHAPGTVAADRVSFVPPRADEVTIGAAASNSTRIVDNRAAVALCYC